MSCIEALCLGVPVIISEECNIDFGLGAFDYKSNINLLNVDRNQISKFYKEKFGIKNYSKKLISLITNNLKEKI